MQPAAVTTNVGPMTVHEWTALPEDEPGELCDGLLEGEAVADLTHETVVLWLGAQLRGWAVALGGFAFGSEVKYALSSIRGRKADLSVFFPGRPALPRRGPVTTAPDIAVDSAPPRLNAEALPIR